MPHDTVAGQIGIGRLVLEVGGPHGAALREAMRAERAHPRPRPGPILLRPRLLRGLVDRRIELAAVMSALDAGMLVEISGEPGIGKTALLRHLAHHPRASAFADGIVYISARDESSIDLLQRLFEAFYESDTPVQPTIAEIRRGLQGKQALILIDDMRVSQDGLDLALDSAPRCAFVVATREPCLWGELRSLALTELPVEDAAALLEREAARSFEPAERSAAETLCAGIGGNPLRIQQAAALIRERQLSLETSIETWASCITPESLLAELTASVDEKQRRILLALSALPGIPLDSQHVSGIAETTDVEALTMPLVQRGLVLTVQSRYLLADGVADRLRRTDDLKPWVNRAITYFTAWAERHRRSHESLLSASDALVRVQEHAVDTKRWGEALRLGRLLEATLILHGRWGAWDIIIDRCLAAARATRDRAAEAWALHEIGTRAVCLGGGRLARRALGQAASMRDELGEPGAAAVSRQNLEFLAPAAPIAPAADEIEAPVEAPVDLKADVDVRPARRFDDIGERQSPPPRAVRVVRKTSRSGEYAALLLTVALSVTLGAFVYYVAFGGAPMFHAAAPDPPIDTAATSTGNTPSTAPSTGAAAASALEAAPSGPEKASIRIFTARPGSIATAHPTDLCYAVSGAVETRIEPGIGRVAAADTLTCRRVMPMRTTTYELTAIGRDGDAMTQQLVIVVR